MAVSMSVVLAAARNVASFAAGAAVSFGLLSATQGHDVTTAIGQISQGVAQIGAGVGAIIGIVAPIWAAYRSTKTAQVASVQANPDTHVVTTDPAVKAAVPSVTLASKRDANVLVEVPRP